MNVCVAIYVDVVVTCSAVYIEIIIGTCYGIVMELYIYGQSIQSYNNWLRLNFYDNRITGKVVNHQITWVTLQDLFVIGCNEFDFIGPYWI